MNDTGWILSGGHCLDGDGIIARDCFIDGGVMAGDAPKDARRFDAGGLILAPGIIDVHGDGFERNVSPRPKVFFDMAAALIETDRQLIANGITTAYLALTISWEPGLRSLDQARLLIETLERVRPELACDIRVQLRWEIFALHAADQVQEWLSMTPTPTLAFNDHFSGIQSGGRESKKIPEYAARAGMTEPEYRTLIDEVMERADEVPGTVARLANAAHAAGVPTLAHDEKDAEARLRHRDLGIVISEFPLSRGAAETAIAAGEPTVLGAPNVLRGGSHIGAIDAAPAIAEGLCSVLASDYYYPAPFLAVHKMSAGDPSALAKHWPLISGNAARASGLTGRGQLAEGKRADIVAFRQAETGPKVEAVFRDGRLVHSASASRV
jgi:alpha-D-ribose 1-methylphosphonate 5-triphosphate diphosphatase